MEQEDYISDADLPVLDPPPGFEDNSPYKVEDHYYDDPYSDGEDQECKAKLSKHAVNQFAEAMASALLKTAIPRPKVKMRLKKTQPLPKLKCHSSESEVYSLPFDSLMESGKETGAVRNRHSSPTMRPEPGEPVHMSLEEVRGYFREYHGSISSSRRRPWMIVPSKSVESPSESKRKSCFVWTPHLVSKANSFDEARTKRSRKSLSVTAAGIKQALFNVFRISSHHPFQNHSESTRNEVCTTGWTFSFPDSRSEPQQLGLVESPRQHRALPPLPREDVGFVRVPPRSLPVRQYSVEDQASQSHLELNDSGLLNSHVPNSLEASDEPHSSETPETPASNRSKQDFAASIEAVKDYGWYWGPLSGEAAEKILANEPDGSFLVRDSSDDHYIFSLSFKLNGGVRHVRIEHDHGRSPIVMYSARHSVFFSWCRKLQFWKRRQISKPNDGGVH